MKHQKHKESPSIITGVDLIHWAIIDVDGPVAGELYNFVYNGTPTTQFTIAKVKALFSV